MVFKNYSRGFWTIVMAIMMTNIPHIAWAEAAGNMIPTIDVVETLSRSQAEQRIQTHLNNAQVRSELEKRGISPDEVSNRMASLSTSELSQMAQQMDEARYGGDVVGILVVVLLVILIIYLAKRI